MREKSGVLAINRTFLNIRAKLLVPAVLLAFASCDSQPAVKTTEIEEPDETIVVETYQVTAEVTNIDSRTRQVTLAVQDGTTKTFTAGEDVRNFDQLRVGDKIQVTLLEEVAVQLRKQGEPPGAGAAAAVAVAPKGEKPGIVMAKTVALSARLTEVDVQGRQVTLELPDGSIKTLKVRNKKVDLTKVSPGDNLVMQVTEAMAIVVKPQ